MTKKEYRNQLEKYLKDQEINLKDCLENSRYQLDYQQNNAKKSLDLSKKVIAQEEQNATGNISHGS